MDVVEYARYNTNKLCFEMRKVTWIAKEFLVKRNYGNGNGSDEFKKKQRELFLLSRRIQNSGGN